MKCNYESDWRYPGDDDVEKHLTALNKDFKAERALMMKMPKGTLVRKVVELEKQFNGLCYSLKTSMSTITMLRQRIDELSISYKTLLEKK